MRNINTDKKVYYSVCITLAFILAVLMIYREIPHKSGDETIEDRLIPEAVTVCVTENENNTNFNTVSEPDNNAVTAENTAIIDNNASGLVNINTADLKTLMTLKGIGEKKAQNIIDHRTTNGNFGSIDDLADVPGIGAKTVESLRPFVTV